MWFGNIRRKTKRDGKAEFTLEFYLGIDIGSTTVKVVLMDENWALLYKSYARHFSLVREKTAEALEAIRPLVGGGAVKAAICGSAGLGVARSAGVNFVQEVYAVSLSVEKFLPGTDVVIELGGEDAKILFLTGGVEERMNGSCAGGTGSFIDQMATLLDIEMSNLDALYDKHEHIYPIASRCGVFAKSDIQPLLNQGAHKEDLTASIFQAVVDQTVAGLAQGRKIGGQVAFLGGPLSFFSGLRDRFIKTLKLTPEQAIFPEDAAYFIAMGAAIYASKMEACDFDTIMNKITKTAGNKTLTNTLPPLFEDEADYQRFLKRHQSASVPQADIQTASGPVFLGIDAGSTTTKMVLITPQGEILHSFYCSNMGDPVEVVKSELLKMYELMGDRMTLVGTGVTGYGEDLIENAFCADFGVVETVAHYRAARRFCPEVDFILDIGGQDIKCFRVRNGAVDSIMLNEACSSGCGSFIETFAKVLGYTAAEFAALGRMARHPVDLGSRCTVFMNSSVKQSQKDGAGVDDISAGLSMSVVKNAVYKVIRAPSVEQLGKNIVVQGGTFYNDAVLRSFELELGREVIRPNIAGLMGAYGAALIACDRKMTHTELIDAEALAAFTHTAKPAVCGLCGNHCKLNINTFPGGRKSISGNRCERPLGSKLQDLPDMVKYKYESLAGLKGKPGKRGKIGLPLGLNMYENLPFWHAFFTKLEFEVVLSPKSDRDLYISGQYSIPSDTVCYPAKLLHGHVEQLLNQQIPVIFYPCMPYNFDEGISDNHYNCPVVAYYPELLEANVAHLKKTRYLTPYFELTRRKDFIRRAEEYFTLEFGIDKKEISAAADKAYAAYEAYKKDVVEEGRKALAFAAEHGKKVVVLAGRPYHIDPEVNHGINQLITSLGLVVVTEDAVSPLMTGERVKVLNQWTYHARLYAAAQYCVQHPDVELVQLVSFGCGLDAITADETRQLLEQGGKLYTQLKIDEISNLGAVKIRLRSMLAALESRGGATDGRA